MSRIFYLIVGLLAPGAVLAQTQPGMIPGFMSAAGTNGCPTTRACFVPYSAANPLPVDATITATATTTATASSTPTAVSAGTDKPLNIDLHSSLFVQPTFAGTPVDLTHGLPVNVVAGGAGTSSAFDAAFPANGTAAGLSDGTNMKAWLTALALGDGTNGNNTGAVASWLWNGATYDRQKGDATNGAFVNVKTSVLPTGGATAANQATANGSLATIVTNTTGAATAANQTTTNTALGAPADAACGTATGTCSVEALLKFLNTTASGAIPAGAALIGKVGIDQTTPGTTNGVSIAQIGGTTVVNGGVAGSQSIGGTVATNVAITANPLNLGAQAVSSENTAVTTARQVQLVADLVGKLIVSPYANSDNFVSGVTSAMTGTTSTSLIAAPASGLRNYLTQCTFSNSHATVGTMMILQDGSGGTTIAEFPAAAVFGGSSVTFPTPLRQPTTATALFVQNVTTGANTFASCSGYIGR